MSYKQGLLFRQGSKDDFVTYLVNFSRAVSKMRSLQKKYFRTRDKQILSESKYQEKVVDEYLSRIIDHVAAKECLDVD